MRIKTVLGLATVVLFLAAGWSGDCFAGSDSVSAPESAKAAVPGATRGEPAGTGVVLQSTDQVEVQMDASGGNNGGNPSLEEAEPSTNKAGHSSYSRIGIGLKVSTLGAGIEVATPLAEKINLRGGLNIFQYNRGITNDGIHYTGHLQFRSAEAHLDWFPIGAFHISPGVLFYNGNQLTANAAVPGGQTFKLNGNPYVSDPLNPVAGTGKLDFVKVSPSIMLGFGNLIPRNGRHYSFLFEIGGAYQGSARVALNFTGSACTVVPLGCLPVATDPTIQANIQAQQQKIKNDLNPYRFFPVVSLGVGFNF